MHEPIRVRDLVSELGISKAHASNILAAKQSPGLGLAIRIYRKLGVKLGPIADASEREIDTLEKVGAKRVTE